MIDKYLDDYISDSFGVPYKWWWNANNVLAEAIASACRHVRLDGCHLIGEEEKSELQTLERYMTAYPLDVPIDQELWLHAEAMRLLGKWFARLWD